MKRGEERLRLERYNRDAIRVMRGESVVGMLLRHSDELWSVNDTQERRLLSQRYAAPRLGFRRACEAGVFDHARKEEG